MARIAWIVVVMVILRINASIYIHHLIFGDQPSVRFAWWIMNGQALRARQPSELLGLPRHYVLHRIAEWLDLADDRVKDLKKLIHGCSFVQNQISSSEKGARRHSLHVWTRTQNKFWPRRPCFSFIQNFSVLKLLSKIALRRRLSAIWWYAVTSTSWIVLRLFKCPQNIRFRMSSSWANRLVECATSFASSANFVWHPFIAVRGFTGKTVYEFSCRCQAEICLVMEFLKLFIKHCPSKTHRIALSPLAANHCQFDGLCQLGTIAWSDHIEISVLLLEHHIPCQIMISVYLMRYLIKDLNISDFFWYISKQHQIYHNILRCLSCF